MYFSYSANPSSPPPMTFDYHAILTFQETNYSYCHNSTINIPRAAATKTVKTFKYDPTKPVQIKFKDGKRAT